MSMEEEALLELVLDNFSNIKEVLNATKDVENFLIKLKLHKKKRGIDVIFDKVKNLVDSLYDHSAKVKDEFYKHFNNLENIPIEKENSGENGLIGEESDLGTVEPNNSTLEENGECVSNKDTQDIENENNGVINDENNCENEIEASDPTENQNEDVDHINNIATENIDNATVGNVDILKSPDVDRSGSLEKEKESNSDDIAEKSSKLEIDNPPNDPLDVRGNSPDVIDNSNTSEGTTSKIDKDIGKNSIVDEDTSSENMTVKMEPRIRLVDLSKLIDPKPKKCVKFDSSVIILTSSDEESSTPKKKNDVTDQNSKLKPVLKASIDKNIFIDADAQHRSTDGKSLEGERSQYNLVPEENDLNSSDNEKEKNKKKQKEKRNKGKTVKKSDKNESLLEKDRCFGSDGEKRKTNKNRDLKKGKENSSDSEVCDQLPSKKKKVSKEKEQTSKDDSDSTDCIIQENSDSEIREQNESPPSYNSRRSTRLHKRQNEKQKKKNRLRTLFTRKLSKHGTSRFALINKKSDDSDSDTDSGSKLKQTSLRKKKDLVEEHLSDTSSLSGDEIEDVEIHEKSKKSKKRKRQIDVPNNPSDLDQKFTYEVYIPLPQIECERLKEIYLSNKEILEIKRLKKIDLPKSTKRSHKNQNESKSSSDTEKPKSKKSRSVTGNNEIADESTSDDEPLTDLAKRVINEKGNEVDAVLQKSVENEDARMADILMDKMESSDSEMKKDDKSNSESEEDENNKCNQSKNKHTEEEISENNENEKEEEQIEKKASKSKDDGDTSEKEDKDDNTSEKEDKNDTSEEEDKNDTSEKEDKDDQKSEDEGSSEKEKKKKKKKWCSDKLLTSKIDSTDSEEDFSKYNKRKEKSREELMSDDEIPVLTVSKRITRKRIKQVVSDSDESDNEKNKGDGSDKNESSETSSSSSEAEKDKEEKKPGRRRIRTAKDSSSSSEDISTRKHIRKVIGKDALSETTKQAEAEEKERKARIAEKQKKYNQIYENLEESKVEKVVLDYDEKEKKELLSIHKGFVKKLKPHQASGIQFMWDACFESLERTKSTIGSGCILAHCMGLGKTLQVVALSHTLLTNSAKTGIEKIMVVCPVNTVLNWKAEFKKWMPRGNEVEVYELVSCKQNYDRQHNIQEWHNDGGVLIIGYTMFRNLSNPDNKRISRKMRNVFQEGLVDPGPDLVVCDEGHLLKNEKTNLSIAMNRIKTLRRIVLTGTPLQNNLKEYWCMVQFIKPNLLGTYKEYLNRFVNPITNGQYTDSTQHDIILMRKRSHVLHKLLDGVVQRRDYSVLEPYLPPKHEYVLFVSLTEAQVKLYKHYMERFARQNDGSNRTSFLFTDFQQLQRICTHPRVLLDRSKEKKEKEFDSDTEGSLKDFIDDGEESGSSSSSSSKSNSGSEGSNSDKSEKKSKQQKTRVTRAQAALRKENNEESESEVEEIHKEWWQEYCDGEELDNINNSGKLFLLFKILKECEEIGDKVLVFSQSLYTLNCIEYFLQKIDEATQDGSTEKVGGYSGSWSLGLDYFRLDGSSSCDNRATWCNNFNNPDNIRARLFLISTKAGGLGINLVAANRVIIFDVSWNPSHDIQSIYRVYRFGQTKPCYIYRFVSYGTMEMKIYERQVTKQAISKRVIDEQQIDRHYNQNDLQELYKCDLEPTDRPIPLVPKDVLLGELLQNYDKLIYKYHLHQSLLENKEAEGLNEEERKAAWDEFENEKVLRKTTSNGLFNNFNINAHAIAAALASIVRKDNPTWSEVQIKGIIPALVQQLQAQLSEGDVTMYARVQKEMQLMQAIQAQKMKEAFYQQQVMRMIEQQQQQAKILGNMHVDPIRLARTQATMFNNHLGSVVGGPSSAPPTQMSSDVIELND